MSKRFLSAVLALALCTGLSACSENPNDINANSVSETTAVYESTKEIVIPDETVTPDEDTTSDETTTEEETLTDMEEFMEGETIRKLTTTRTFIPADDEFGFYFGLELPTEEVSAGLKVTLYSEDGKQISEMKANDENVYSCYFKPNTDSWVTYNVYAVYGDNVSNTVRVRTYTDDVLPEDNADFKKVIEEFGRISSKYANSLGRYSAENKVKAFSEAAELAKKMYEDSRVVEVRISPDTGNVTIKHNCGTTYSFTTEQM